MELSENTRRIVRGFMKNELTESVIYKRIAARLKNKEDAATLMRIAEEEEAHAKLWRGYIGEDVSPNKGKIRFYTFISRIFGYTFALKLMENGEAGAQKAYAAISEEIPEARAVAEQEDEHENALLALLDEDRLQYIGSMVLGLNDALVELSGTLAGLSLAMQNTRYISLSGLITGIAAALSMASSEYLSAKSEGRGDAMKSALYTGGMYICAVALLVLPYLLFPPEHFLYALFTMLAVVIVVIFVFTYYISVAKGFSFKKRFLEMAGISLGVAALSFVIGLLVKEFLGIEM